MDDTAPSNDDIDPEEGDDTFDESASSLTCLGEDMKTPPRWIHPGPHSPTRLRFSDEVEVRITTGLHEYTPEEIYQCWMDDLDEADSQEEIVDTVKHMRKPPADWWRWYSAQQGTNTDDGKTNMEQQEEDFSRYLEEKLGLCTRGIEHMKSRSAREQRKLRRKFIAQVVLEEQEHQRRLEMHNSDAIREGANVLSRKSTEKATKAAAVDEQYADLRRASLPAQYAKTVKQMFFADSTRKLSVCSTGEAKDGTDEGDLTSRRRTSSISYEKHDGVVMEEICRIVESEDDNEQTQKNASSASEEEPAKKSILSRMKDDIIRAKEEEGVVQKEESSLPRAKEEITGITDSLQNTHLPKRNDDAPKRRTLVSTRNQISFRRIGQPANPNPATGNFLDTWGNYQYHSNTSTCSGQQHMRRLMHTQTKST